MIGACFCFLAVALGAFGAHFLRSRLDSASLEVFKTGTNYQFLHGFALILATVCSSFAHSKWLARSSIAFIAGTIVFSGSLYALALTSVRGFGAIAPIGGILLLAGWTCFAVALSPLDSQHKGAA